MNEIARWTPSFTALRFHGTMSERERVKGLCKDREYDIYVTSYEQFVLERHWFGNKVWRYVVVDEGMIHNLPQVFFGVCCTFCVFGD